jgi:hypothetical protein
MIDNVIATVLEILQGLEAEKVFSEDTNREKKLEIALQLHQSLLLARLEQQEGLLELIRKEVRKEVARIQEKRSPSEPEPKQNPLDELPKDVLTWYTALPNEVSSMQAIVLAHQLTKKDQLSGLSERQVYRYLSSKHKPMLFKRTQREGVTRFYQKIL